MRFYIINTIILILVNFYSCKKYVEIDAPRTDLIQSTIFSNDATAQSAVSAMYSQLVKGNFMSGSIRSFTFVSALSSDELQSYFTSGQAPLMKEFNDNNIDSKNSINTGLWSEPYSIIYQANSIIEGLAGSSTISQPLKGQLIGEAKFFRAFCHFYLTNMFGEIPLAITTDYKLNQIKERSSRSEIYNQIVKDLSDAQQSLPNDFSASNGERVRINKMAASAFLARVYLYQQKWAEAEAEATNVLIDNNFLLEPNLTDVFTTTSREAIWQLWSNNYPADIFSFYIFGTPTTGALRNDFVNDFESTDKRLATWIGTSSGYYFAKKYQSFTPAAEYTTILRLAEQYLIRAEARAQQNKIVGTNSAEEDINILRDRSGLLPVTVSTKADMLAAIEHERKTELFTECGHRWMDLKRTGHANDLLSAIKGANWQVTDTLYPIPLSQILNSEIKQNTGYN